MTADTIRAEPGTYRWEPLTPEAVAARFAALEIPWFVAGGWALDLFMGRQTRAHDDIDVAIFRGDEAALAPALPGWEFFVAESGTLTRWDPRAPLPRAAHELWARERGQEPWRLEILIEERAGSRWTYRRNAAVGLNATDLGRRTPEGIPFIRPEVQLLYISKAGDGKGETDFLTVLPRLDPGQRGFLAAALWTVSPGHRWLTRLK